MFIARLPILNRHHDVYGYQLLYHNQGTDPVKTSNGTKLLQDTASIVSALFENGLETVVGSHWIFLSVDLPFLSSRGIELLDPAKVVLVIPFEQAAPPNLEETLISLRKKGFRFAAKGTYTYPNDTLRLLDLVDFITLDFHVISPSRLEGFLKTMRDYQKILLAEKIETQEAFKRAESMGFDLFQGLYFSKPEFIVQSQQPSTTKLFYFQMILEIKKEEPSFQKLAQLIQKDVSFAYRLLKVASNKTEEVAIESIKQALILMGLQELERWLQILLLQDLGHRKPKVLIELALARSHFAETLAGLSRQRDLRQAASMMGLFSVLDGILDLPMDLAFENISVDTRVTEALIKKEGPLFPYLSLILAYEEGDWERVQSEAVTLNTNTDAVSTAYRSSLAWAKGTMNNL